MEVNKIRLLTIAGSVVLLLLILDLVRRRRLKEEYSALWVVAAVVLLVLSLWYDALDWLTRAIGAVAPSSTLFFSALLFVLFMLLHFSIRVSTLERRLTILVQEIALRTSLGGDENQRTISGSPSLPGEAAARRDSPEDVP